MDTRKIDSIAAGIILFIFVFVYFAFIKESRTKVAVLKEEEAVLLENLNSAGDMNFQLDRIIDEIDYIQKNLEAFDRQLPEEKRMYDFLTEIDKLAKKNNIQLKDIRPGKLEKEALYSKIPVNISGTSGFKDFYRFLFQLENIPRITKMERLLINNVHEGYKCNIEMDLAIFVGRK